MFTSIAETDTAMDAIRTLTQHGISGAPVVNAQGYVIGFVSDGDILRLVANQVRRIYYVLQCSDGR